MSFASEPGRDDGSLPPVNVVIPDDARELDRDVLAYRREQRAGRRRQRLLRLVRPFNRPEFGGHAAIVPLIAACLALSLVGGALLSVATISPASAPTISSSQPGPLTTLPTGTVQLDGQVTPVRSLVSSAVALVPAGCDCGQALSRLASQAITARVGLYFIASGATASQAATLTARYGGRAAVAGADTYGVLDRAYHPAGLIVLLVFKDATARVLRNPSPDFQLGTTLSNLKLAGRSLPAP